MKHSIVVILVNYNGFNVTKECLQSIAENEPQLPFIILVDNASKDSEQLDLLHDVYPQLKIIRNDTNFGFGVANNIGIQWAQEHIDFNFLILLNNDTTITPSALSSLTTNFREDQIGMVTCRTMLEQHKDTVWYGGSDINYNYGEPKVADYGSQPTTGGALKSRYVTFASGCLMVFTRESIAELGGFDDQLFMYVEDTDLSIRCVKKGMKIWYDGSTVIYHKVQGSFAGSEQYKDLHPKNKNICYQLFALKVNQWIVFRKHLSGGKFLKFSMHYWVKLSLIVARLVVYSPKRFQVIGVYFKIINAILFHRRRRRIKLLNNSN